MTFPTERAARLLFAYGNPSRGDDALGPAVYESLQAMQQENGQPYDIELLTDYQLQIEHAIDLEQREAVLFVDASLSGPAPYSFQQLQAMQDNSYTTHAMSPAAVLAVYGQINHVEPPAAYLLTIRGYEFALGQPLTQQAEKNLVCALDFIKTLLTTSTSEWKRSIMSHTITTR